MTSTPEHPAQQPPTAAGSPIAPVWNLPNVLTMLRIVLVPVFVVLLWQDTTVTALIALAVFLLAAATDKLDGTIARRRGIVTNFGKIADPFADKLLTGAAMMVLSLMGLMPWWATILILVREIGITVLRFVMVRRSVIAASSGGKLKTVLQVVFLSMMMLPATALFPAPVGDWWDIVAYVVMVLATLVTVVTGLDYCWRAWRIVREQKA
ncbi:MAG TPA: CDP-diacylglycerol--glycerol-3-phosphate 3-phosphatidyltransferase [Ruania sp.]|nr:CDP-diacylglycerol--glycerol-3-phosphate 3-phosphatidyltransferase [Ruania sp.]